MNGKIAYSKAAFTLAEVLITLAIIGVVAALTIPTVVKNYQKQQTATQIKKAYTQLYQAINMSEIDNSSVDGWDYALSSEAFYNKYLKDYLKVIKYYGSVTTASMGINYKWLNGNDSTANFTKNTVAKLILNDGFLVGVGPTSGNYRTIDVDINAFKGPNQYGKDVFQFTLQPKYKLMAYGYGDASLGEGFGTQVDRDTLLQDNGYACNKNRYGIWCAALIMVDNWQIKDDYPW